MCEFGCNKCSLRRTASAAAIRCSRDHHRLLFRLDSRQIVALHSPSSQPKLPPRTASRDRHFGKLPGFPHLGAKSADKHGFTCCCCCYLQFCRQWNMANICGAIRYAQSTFIGGISTNFFFKCIPCFLLFFHLGFYFFLFLLWVSPT